MQEPTSFGYQEEQGAPVEAQPQRPSGSPFNPSQYKFSSEELRVLQECNSESFFKRSLPLGTLFGLGTYSAVQGGYLRPNARFGPFPKVTLAVIVGYFVGKLSYQQTCAEKLMALPGSYIGQLLRDRRDGKVSNSMKQSPTMFGARSDDIYSDAGPGNSLDLDTDRPLFGDDTYRPDAPGGDLAEGSQPLRPALSYDDLRRKNRGDYTQTRQDPYRMDTNMTPPIGRARTPSPPPTTSTNKYGDAME